jgi:hypothetical protein
MGHFVRPDSKERYIHRESVCRSCGAVSSACRALHGNWQFMQGRSAHTDMKWLVPAPLQQVAAGHSHCTGAYDADG